MKVQLPEKYISMDTAHKMPRRLRKIAVEKKRRERIDGCLSQIKELLCKGSKQQNKNVKMERAELMENVLQFIQQRTESEAKQHQINISQAHSSTNNNVEYRLGFEQCMIEANQMVEKLCRNKSSVNIKQYMQNRLSQLYVKSTAGQKTEKAMDRIDNSNYYLNKSRDMMCKNMHQIQNSMVSARNLQVKGKLEFSTVCRSSLQSNTQKYRDMYHNYITSSALRPNVTDVSMGGSLCKASNDNIQAVDTSVDSGYNTSVDVSHLNGNSIISEPAESYINMKFKLNRITKNSVQPNVWRPW